MNKNIDGYLKLFDLVENYCQTEQDMHFKVWSLQTGPSWLLKIRRSCVTQQCWRQIW